MVHSILQNWGAGPTKPFLNRIPVDRGFGHWAHWTVCTVTCGGSGIFTQFIDETLFQTNFVALKY